MRDPDTGRTFHIDVAHSVGSQGLFRESDKVFVPLEYILSEKMNKPIWLLSPRRPPPMPEEDPSWISIYWPYMAAVALIAAAAGTPYALDLLYQGSQTLFEVVVNIPLQEMHR